MDLQEVSDTDTTGLNVPLRLRSNELAQLHEYIPRLVEIFETVDTENTRETAYELRGIDRLHVYGVEATYPEDESFANYVSMPAEDWIQVIVGLARLRREEGLRVWYLRRKLFRRLQDRLDELQ